MVFGLLVGFSLGLSTFTVGRFTHGTITAVVDSFTRQRAFQSATLSRNNQVMAGDLTKEASRVVSPGKFVRLLEAVVLIVLTLYFGRPVLLPVAIAILLTFLLAPAVSWFEAKRVPRGPAVLLVGSIIFASLGLIVWKTSEQFSDLVNHLPEYQENLRAKVRTLQDNMPGAFQRISETMSEVSKDLDQTSETIEGADTSKSPGSRAVDPTPVTVVPGSQGPLERVWMTLSSVVGPLGSAAVVTILVIFMLITREDLRNRLVRLVGTRQVNLTTKTMDEMSSRISRYLLMNALVNGGFGLVVGLGLFALGVHYAALWGFLAAILRFVPYIGPIVASVLPVAMAVVQSPGWTQPILALSLFIVLELVTNNFVEPLVYGKSAGISTVALLLAAVFWAWLWGPLGLMLSVPLTVVLAVLGRYLPPLRPLWVLLGDEAPLEPYVQYYQRLLATDTDEAVEVVEDYGKAHTPIEACDDILLPALALAERDQERGELPQATQHYIWEATRQVVEDLFPEPTAASATHDAPASVHRLYIIGTPAQDAADEMALAMLSNLAPANVEFAATPIKMLASELIGHLTERRPALVCISSLGPVGMAHTRYLCKRLHMAFPNLPILASRWAYSGDREKFAQAMQSRGASFVATSLGEALDVMTRVQPLADPGSEKAASSSLNVGEHAA